MKIIVSTLLLAGTLVCSGPGARAEPADPVGPADRATLRHFLDDNRQSSNLRLRVMFGTIGDPENGAVSGKTWTPMDQLADQVRGSTDPMVLALMIGPCGNDRVIPKPACDPVEMAKRWTQADTQNQIAWLALASALRSHGEPAEARAAFVRAADASAWHEYYDDGVRTVAQAIPKSLGPRARLLAFQVALSMPAAQLLAMSQLSTLSSFCKDTTLRPSCVRIIDTIARDEGSLVSFHMSNRIAALSGFDAGVVATRERKYRALTWTSIRAFPVDLEELDDDALASAITTFDRRVALGEMTWLRERFTRSGMEEADAAARYQRRFEAAVGTTPAPPSADSTHSTTASP